MTAATKAKPRKISAKAPRTGRTPAEKAKHFFSTKAGRRALDTALSELDTYLENVRGPAEADDLKLHASVTM